MYLEAGVTILFKLIENGIIGGKAPTQKAGEFLKLNQYVILYN